MGLVALANLPPPLSPDSCCQPQPGEGEKDIRKPTGQPGRQITRRARRQPDLLLFAAPPQWLGAPAADGYRLHIVDPLGRRVIDYPAAVGGKELRFDLERLLKFAWTG